MFEGPLVKITSQLSPRDIKPLEPSMSITYSSLFASKRVVCSLCDLKFRPLRWHGKSNQTFLSLSTIHDVSRQLQRTIFLIFPINLQQSTSYGLTKHLKSQWMASPSLQALLKIEYLWLFIKKKCGLSLQWKEAHPTYSSKTIFNK